jgi:alkanesulfonate monooxygenase SsuD/methylene tetrahydromethanopterin reductase-like flavin-dependent oxidoreductase (luciferase family)
MKLQNLIHILIGIVCIGFLPGAQGVVPAPDGGFTESFPLFGYDLRDYDQLFEEKLDLFVKLLDEKPVTWNGTMRAPLENADVFPKTESGRLTTWVGVGGTPQSVVRTARYGLPLMLAIIGGPPERFAGYIELYRRAAALAAFMAVLGIVAMFAVLLRV